MKLKTISKPHHPSKAFHKDQNECLITLMLEQDPH